MKVKKKTKKKNMDPWIRNEIDDGTPPPKMEPTFFELENCVPGLGDVSCRVSRHVAPPDRWCIIRQAYDMKLLFSKIDVLFSLFFMGFWGYGTHVFGAENHFSQCT